MHAGNPYQVPRVAEIEGSLCIHSKCVHTITNSLMERTHCGSVTLAYYACCAGQESIFFLPYWGFVFDQRQ